MKAILLQTAQATVSGSGTSNVETKLRILFDSGSQLSYITPQARSQLQLQSLGMFKVSLKTFGKTNEEKQLEKVRFLYTLGIDQKKLVSRR